MAPRAALKGYGAAVIGIIAIIALSILGFAITSFLLREPEPAGDFGLERFAQDVETSSTRTGARSRTTSSSRSTGPTRAS